MSSSSSSSSQQKKPRDPVFLLAAVHAFFVSFPPLVQSLAGTLTADDPLAKWALPAKSIETLTTPGIGKVYFDFFCLLVTLFAFGYWRIYVDGPARQPLVLFLGMVGKFLVAILFTHAYWQGAFLHGILVVGVIPDAVLAFYYLWVWTTKLNCTLVAVSQPKND